MRAGAGKGQGGSRRDSVQGNSGTLKRLEGKFHQPWWIWVRLERDVAKNANSKNVPKRIRTARISSWLSFCSPLGAQLLSQTCELFYKGTLHPPAALKGQNIFNPIHRFTWCLHFLTCLLGGNSAVFHANEFLLLTVPVVRSSFLWMANLLEF